MKSPPLVFDCTACGQSLKAPGGSEGKLCKCTKCATLVRIPNAEAPPPPPPPRPSGPPRNPLHEELESLAHPRARYPGADAYAVPGARSPGARSPGDSVGSIREPSASFVEMSEQPKRRRSKKRSGKSSGTSVVSVLITVFAGMAFLCCGGLGVAGFFVISSTAVVKAGGYQATAKGFKSQAKVAAGTSTEGTLFAVTGSEFWVGAVPIPGGNAASLDDVRRYFDGFSELTTLVTRADLNGIHCKGVDTSVIGVQGGLRADMEFFLVNNTLLYMAYIPGSSKSALEGKPSRTGTRESGWDNSEAFFNSLERAN